MWLRSKIFIKGKIKLLTGLHIGGSKSALDIGGVDNLVIKLADGIPYIPGSSIKGKLRCLLEREMGHYHIQIFAIKENGRKEKVKESSRAADISKDDLRPQEEEKKRECVTSPCQCGVCNVCKIFGTTSSEEGALTRLYVRDAHLDKDHFNNEREKLFPELEGDYTEVKWENTIDRLTSKAKNPRQTERVPAGAQFDFEFVFTVYEDGDIDLLKDIIKAMRLLEDDYLGGSGSRGYGQIKFKDITIERKNREEYEKDNISQKIQKGGELKNIDLEELIKKLKENENCQTVS